MADYREKESVLANEKGQAHARSAKQTTIGLTLLAALLGVGLGLLLARMIARRLAIAVQAVKEVAAGFECGISIDSYRDVKEGDQLEAFELKEEAAELK